MTNHHCTYFDRGYLAQGLAMWRSLERHDAQAMLWVLALDGETAGVLGAIGGTSLRVVALAELLAGDAELHAAQAERSRKEFIFTLTPCLVRHLLRTQPEIERLVYLDADLFFFSNPAPIAQEWADGSVFVVPHRYPSWHDDSARYGRFNVGVLGFRRDASAVACVDWWRMKCLESCALTSDGTHYGDQKYLDEWPERFAGVVIAKCPGVNLAPWNWAGCQIAVDGPTGVRVEGQPLVVFHFAQFRRIGDRWWDSGQLEYGIMPRRLRSRIYGPYAAALEAAADEVRTARPDFSLPRTGWRAALGPWHLAALRIFWGQFWLRAGGQWFVGRFGLGRFSGNAMAGYRRWQRREK